MKTIRKEISRKALGLTLAMCLLLSTLVGALVINLSGTLAAPEGADSISGYIWAGESGQPLAGYPVALYNAQGEEEAQALTGEDGAYRFEGLAPGRYVVGIAPEGVDGEEALLPAGTANGGALTADAERGMAFSEVIEIQEPEEEIETEPETEAEIETEVETEAETEPKTDPEAAIEATTEPETEAETEAATEAAVNVRQAPAARAGNSYTINVNTEPSAGVGYTYDAVTKILSFNTGAAGNHYKIEHTSSGIPAIRGIAFAPNSNPASVTMTNLTNISKSISIPAGFTTDLIFDNVDLTAYGANTTGDPLVIPADYSGKLEINGLKVTTLTFQNGYSQPLTFNGLTATVALNYPTGYNQPITIASNFNVKGSHFPAGYSGPITIGGGTFTGTQYVCRATSKPGNSALDMVVIPDNIKVITLKDAKTEGNGNLYIRLGTGSNDKELTVLLDGNSNINGYIEVPTKAALTIDSAAGKGSESGKLAIRSTDTNACIGYSQVGDSGMVTIQGGTVEATQAYTPTSDPKYYPAAIGGGASKNGYVTITGGKVTAIGNKYGAGIGGGSDSKGGTVLITGGTVTARGGDMGSIQQGGTGGYGAGIGGGKQGYVDHITITGGFVTAESGAGAGIGTGGLENGVQGSGLEKGIITITGGVIRGYSNVGANIGKGYNKGAYIPKYEISTEADILMYGRGNGDIFPGVECAGTNGKDGYFVSAQIAMGTSCAEQIRGNIYVFDATTKALVKTLLIPHSDANYMSFLFSTGHNFQERFLIFTDYYDEHDNYVGMRQYFHHWDHVKEGTSHETRIGAIPSIKDLNGTANNPTSYPHQFHNNYANALLVCFGEGEGAPEIFYRVMEHYVDTNGNPIRDAKPVPFKATENYSGTAPDIEGYIYKGYELDNFSSSPSNTGRNVGFQVNGNRDVYFVYEKKLDYTSVTLTKTVEGEYGDRSKEFTFTLLFENGSGPLPGGTTYTCVGVLGGVLTLDGNGTAKVKLAHGQSVTIDNVPTNCTISVTEDEDDAYDVSFRVGESAETRPGRSGTWELAQGPLTLECVNTRKSVPETGVDAGSAGAMLLLPLLAGIAVLGCLAARKACRRRGKEMC